MAQERRKQSLQIDLQDLEQDLESERKAISGLEGLIKVSSFILFYFILFIFYFLTFNLIMGKKKKDL